MDYQALLKQYLQFITDMEGTTYVQLDVANNYFTPEELAELRRLDNEENI